MNPFPTMVAESCPFLPPNKIALSTLERENCLAIVVLRTLWWAHLHSTYRLSKRADRDTAVQAITQHRMALQHYCHNQPSWQVLASAERETQKSLIAAGQAPRTENTPWHMNGMEKTCGDTLPTSTKIVVLHRASGCQQPCDDTIGWKSAMGELLSRKGVWQVRACGTLSQHLSEYTSMETERR